MTPEPRVAICSYFQKALLPVDIRTIINNTRMSGYQWLIIAIAAFLNALDGYDLVAMAFSANAVTEEFGLSASQLGWLLSAALLGIGVGAVLLAPLADKLGRRKIILTALSIDLLGLLMTATADSFTELMLWRLVTGIGVGGILSAVTVLVSEYSNLRFRGLAMSIYSAGYGLGASLCGVLAAQLIPDHGWEAVFLTGAALTAASIVLTWIFVPESADFHVAHGQQDKIASLAARLGKTEPLSPVASAPDSGKAPLSAIFSSRFLAATIKIWIAFSLINFAFNFANQWTPRLLTESGLSAQQGIVGGIMLSFGGTIGSLLYGALTTRIDARKLLVFFSFGSTVVLVGFIGATSLPTLMFLFGVAVGMLLNGCITGLYTITPAAYPSTVRATGVGAAIGVSRLGAVLAPIVIGYLNEGGWSPVGLYTLAAVIVAAAGIVLMALRLTPERTVTHIQSAAESEKQLSAR